FLELSPLATFLRMRNPAVVAPLSWPHNFEKTFAYRSRKKAPEQSRDLALVIDVTTILLPFHRVARICRDTASPMPLEAWVPGYRRWRGADARGAVLVGR